MKDQERPSKLSKPRQTSQASLAASSFSSWLFQINTAILLSRKVSISILNCRFELSWYIFWLGQGNISTYEWPIPTVLTDSRNKTRIETGGHCGLWTGPSTGLSAAGAAPGQDTNTPPHPSLLYIHHWPLHYLYRALCLLSKTSLVIFSASHLHTPTSG